MKKFIFDGYDLSLAVIHRRVWLYEYLNHSNEERVELTWQPTKNFLEDMGIKNPKQIICFYGSQIHYPKKQGCAICYLYVVNSRKEVACIGTVFNATALTHYRKILSEREAIVFKKYDAKKIIRGNLPYCVIPSDREIINELVIIESAKKFFSSFSKKSPVAKLTNALICLLSAQKGAELENEILALAKKTATALSSKERLRKFIDDRGESL